MQSRSARALLALTAVAACLAIATTPGLGAQGAAQPVPRADDIPFAVARPIISALKADLLPPSLRGRAADEVALDWDAWVRTRDADIRTRVAAGDEDSVVTFMLFGVTFTKQPRYGFARVVASRAPAAEATERVVTDPVVRARIRDLAAAARVPGTNERLQFVRRVLERRGVRTDAVDGQARSEAFLVEALRRMLADYDAYFQQASPGATLFKDRGLSSDTSVYAAYAIDAALRDLEAMGGLTAGDVARVGIVGPGLDFADKQEGYDVYPVQTIQPFGVLDSLSALGLSSPKGVSLTTLDLSDRINEHLAAAVMRARAGQSYTVQLPRDPSQRWDPALVRYWQQFGSRIGVPAVPATPPPSLGGLQLKAVRIRPGVVAAITPRDVNIVLQRLEPASDDVRFDLVIATNILIYYDVFEQSLALANIARMLRPGGWLLTNTPLFELPEIPMRLAGETDVSYTPGGHDWVVAYRRE